MLKDTIGIPVVWPCSCHQLLLFWYIHLLVVSALDHPTLLCVGKGLIRFGTVPHDPLCLYSCIQTHWTQVAILYLRG